MTIVEIRRLCQSTRQGPKREAVHPRVFGNMTPVLLRFRLERAKVRKCSEVAPAACNNYSVHRLEHLAAEYGCRL